jgi:CRISPR-associated protein Csd1
MVVPHILRSSGIKPKLLADNGEYVLGVARPTSKPERVAEAHRQFTELAKNCAAATREPSVEAVVRFLERWSPGSVDLLPEDFDAGDTLTFEVDGVRPAVELASVQHFWAEYTADEENPVMTCLVTGKEGPVEVRLPVKIKGVPGGQTSGTALVSANEAPFTSYGLKNSLTSPISREAGERFGRALNELISKRDSRMYIGPLVYVFWTREETGFDYLEMMERPNPQAVRNLLKSPFTAREAHGMQANDFYALSLSASGGRSVVRDWLETTVSEAEANLRRWFRAQEIVDAYGEPADPLGLYPLAATAFRDANKEMIPSVPATLVRVALKGGPLPDDLLVRVVRRTRAEQEVTRPRATLMKLVLQSKGGEEVQRAPVSLDPVHPERAYHCGRLLAELEALQRAAIPGVKATLVDRYYGSASSTPAAVFGTLLSHAQAHIGKLRKGSGGAGPAIQRRMEEIMSNLDGFPNTLTLREQAVFALGYYHQRAQDRAQRNAAVEARKTAKEES